MKTKYEEVGTVPVTIQDLAFIGNVFSIVKTIQEDLTMLNGNMDAIFSLANLNITGRKCSDLVERLSKLEKENIKAIAEYRESNREEASALAARITISALIDSVKSVSYTDTDKKLLEILQGHMEQMKNDPETGYQ